MTIMLLWQAVVLEKWLLVEDPLQPNHLMTISASFVKDYMQEFAFALRGLLKESLPLGKNGSNWTYRNLMKFMKLLGRLPVK